MRCDSVERLVVRFSLPRGTTFHPPLCPVYLCLELLGSKSFFNFYCESGGGECCVKIGAKVKEFMQSIFLFTK
jgi:hypothetical protein